MHLDNIAVSLAFVALGAGCRPTRVSIDRPAVAPTQRADAGTARAEATVGVDDERLREILRDHWDARLRRSPLFATRVGVHDYDDRLGERGPEARARNRRDRDAWLERLDAIDDARLSARDRTTKALLAATLRVDARTDACELASWRVTANTNPVEWISVIPLGHPIGDVDDAENLAARYEAVPALVDAEIADLRDGLSRGWVADAESIRRVLDMVDRQLARPTAEWSLLDPTARVRRLADGPEADALVDRLQDAVEHEIRPALVRYRDLLRDELRPAGRPDASAGLSALPDGAACYAALIEQHTSLSLTAQEVHETGLREIERIDAELAALGRRALGTDTLASTLARLRSDSALFFDTPEAVEAAARASLSRAKAAIPEFFGRLPRTDCVVRRVPDYKAPFTYVGYYEPPHADGSKPGEYFINVSEPTTRPRFSARVLAVHESIPGHHLQIAIAQELEDLPAFRRYAGYNAFVEGWALYAERLGDEMGLYESDLDRLGVLSFDAWRAGRLVVDTGIHAMGWTRADAEAFLTEHTALSPNNISNEVDRYVGWPGQALGYKIGQLEVLALRREAEAALGDDFALSAFHDVVLGGGAVTLPVLRQRVTDWLAKSR